jgi:hypothetical protein
MLAIHKTYQFNRQRSPCSTEYKVISLDVRWRSTRANTSRTSSSGFIVIEHVKVVHNPGLAETRQQCLFEHPAHQWRYKIRTHQFLIDPLDLRRDITVSGHVRYRSSCRGRVRCLCEKNLPSQCIVLPVLPISLQYRMVLSSRKNWHGILPHSPSGFGPS